ncbi:hypothetical protein WAI453_012958 [Rhynchosporium graminicola]|uniref:Uncharacterized protein n=1 Tax=Rhynchosporium graminicola TaxID=2792576 RepID=A0A1E1L9N4_9HELO|nr:uncharacterized protein RCO7_07261 [Rhynchosporium commune]
MVYRHSTIIIIADGVVIAERDSNIATFGPQTRSSQQIRGKKRNTQQDEESEMALFRRIRIKTEIKVRVKVKAILALTTPPNRRVDGSRSESPSMGTGRPRKARVPTFNFEAVVSDMGSEIRARTPGRKAAASPQEQERELSPFGTSGSVENIMMDIGADFDPDAEQAYNKAMEVDRDVLSEAQMAELELAEELDREAATDQEIIDDREKYHSPRTAFDSSDDSQDNDKDDDGSGYDSD